MDNYGGPNVGIREVAFDGYTDHVDMIPYTLNNSGVHDMYYIPIGTYTIIIQPALSILLLNHTPCQHTLSTHSRNTPSQPSQYTLSIHPLNPPSQLTPPPPTHTTGQVVNAGPILRLRLDFYREGFNVPTVPTTGTGRPTHFDIDYIR